MNLLKLRIVITYNHTERSDNMKHYHYNDYEMIIAEDADQNYLILRDRAGICIIYETDLSDDDIDDIRYEFESDMLTDEYSTYEFNSLPFTNLTRFNTWKVIA